MTDHGADDKDALERLGRAIRVERAKRDMTQEMLALESGLHRSHVSKIETGQLNPSFLSLRRIALALDTPLGQLLLD